MILDHVAHDAGGFIVIPAVLDADGLADQHLHVVDVAPIPDRLEQAVCEAQHHDVLHGFFAEVVIDPVDLMLVEDPTDFLIERAGRIEIAPERLLDDDPPPYARRLARETGLAESRHDLAEQVRGCCEVEKNIAAGPMLARDVVEQRRQAQIGLRVAQLAGLVVEGVAQLGPQRLVDGRRGEFEDFLGLLVPKLIARLRPTRDADHR